MIGPDEAITKIFDSVKTLPVKDILLEETLCLVTGRDIESPIDLPPFDNSAMDGFALKLEGIIKLKISQIIRAGDAPKALEPGTCAKIMTGAPVPQGADTVVPIEDVSHDGDFVSFKLPIRLGQHVRYRAEDIKKGTSVVKEGTMISPRLIALFAAMGLTHIPIYPRPRVTIVTTGDELQTRGTKLKEGKIYDSNRVALAALLKEIGIDATTIFAPDNEEDTISTLREALESCDVLFTIGGISVGDYDYVKSALEKLGVNMAFWRVAMKPGKPLAFATLGDKSIFSLPGNPVSCLLTFGRFARPAILKMMGRKDFQTEQLVAKAAEPLKGSKGKRTFLRGICENENDHLMVRSAGVQGSNMLRPLAEANCIIIVPEDRGMVNEGEEVKVELL